MIWIETLGLLIAASWAHVYTDVCLKNLTKVIKNKAQKVNKREIVKAEA